MLDAARCGTMSAAAASAALVYAAEGVAEGTAEGSSAVAGGVTGGVTLLVAEYAARAEPSAEQAPLAASDERVVDQLLRQLRASLPPPIVRAALATDGQRPVLKAASAEMQPDEISLAEVREEMRQLGGRVAAAEALETEVPPPGAVAVAQASDGASNSVRSGVSGGVSSGGGAVEGDGAAAAAAAGWVVVEAEVKKRRRVLASGSTNISMCVLELQDELVKAIGKDGIKAPAAPLLALGHPALHENDAADRRRFDALKQLGATGSRVRLAGRWVETAAGGGRMLLVRAWRLERCCSIPKVVRLAVGSAAEGVLADAEASRALRYAEAGSYRALLLSESSAERRWRVAETSERLQAEAPAPQLGNMELTPAQRTALDTHAKCRERFRLGGEGGSAARPQRASARPALRVAEASGATTATTGTDATASSGTDAASTGMARGALEGSFLNTKKRPQLLFMTEQIRAVLQAHPAWGTRPLHVVDIGGGKGLLSEQIARELGDAVQVSLVELQPELVEAAAARAQRSKQRVPNLKFYAGDAGELLASGVLPPADVFTGLHACGGLSDLILAHAVSSGAGFCVCTCCFMSNRQIALPLTSNRQEIPPLAQKADGGGAADGRLAEQTVSRDAWLGVAPAEVEALLRLAELQASPEGARSAAHTVNALRAAAAERSWDSRWGDASPSATPAAAPSASDDGRAQPQRPPQRPARSLKVEIKGP